MSENLVEAALWSYVRRRRMLFTSTAWPHELKRHWSLVDQPDIGWLSHELRRRRTGQGDPGISSALRLFVLGDEWMDEGSQRILCAEPHRKRMPILVAWNPERSDLTGVLLRTWLLQQMKADGQKRDGLAPWRSALRRTVLRGLMVACL